MSRAEYMREYRAKRKALATGEVPYAASLPVLRAAFDDAQRIVFLENEVARLKRELAQRPSTTIRASGDGVQIVSVETRRGRQAVIDAALAKVNRTARK